MPEMHPPQSVRGYKICQGGCHILYPLPYSGAEIMEQSTTNHVINIDLGTNKSNVVLLIIMINELIQCALVM